MHAGSLESTKDAYELHEAITECNSSFLSALQTSHWTKKWICFKFVQRKYDANLSKLGNKSEQRW